MAENKQSEKIQTVFSLRTNIAIYEGEKEIDREIENGFENKG